VCSFRSHKLWCSCFTRNDLGLDDVTNTPLPVVNAQICLTRVCGLPWDEVAEHFGAGIANGILSEIASDEPTSGTAIARAPKLRRDLGEDLIARVRAFVRPAGRKSK